MTTTKPTPVHHDHTALYVQETQEEIRRLRAVVNTLSYERDAAREALREACGYLRAFDSDSYGEDIIAELCKRGGIS